MDQFSDLITNGNEEARDERFETGHQFQFHEEITKSNPSLFSALKEQYLPKREEIEKVDFENVPITVVTKLISPNILHPRFKAKSDFQCLKLLKGKLY